MYDVETASTEVDEYLIGRWVTENKGLAAARVTSETTVMPYADRCESQGALLSPTAIPKP